MLTSTDGSIKSMYNHLSTDRQWYLDEAYESAKLTIPAIIPTNTDISVQQGNNTPERLVKPWHSIGARGVRNLASKMNLALFPPNGGFMRYSLHPQFKRELERNERNQERAEIELGLATRERIIMDDIEAQSIRPKTDLAFKHLFIAGNVLIYLDPDGGMRVFPLNAYVVRRDFFGDVLEVIFLEMMDRRRLPPEIKQSLLDAGAPEDPTRPGELECSLAGTTRDRNAVEVYTRMYLSGNRYYTEQEADGVLIQGKRGSFSKDLPAFLALRFTAIDGEDYGHGYVEEFRGDLRSLNRLRESIVIGAINAAKLVAMIRPGAAVTPAKLMKAENGAAIFGSPDDVSFLQQQKQGDMTVAQSASTTIEQSVAASFLLNSSFQRQAERVTAEEIRRMAEELEDALGGFYSVTAKDMQLPIALRTEQKLIRQGQLLPLKPKDAVKTVIVTGLAAIGRGHEFNRNREFYGHLSSEVAPLIPNIGQYLKPREIINRAAVGVGIDVDGLVKTDEEVAQETQDARNQAMQQMALEKGLPAFADAAAGEVSSQVASQIGAQAPAQ